MTQRHSLLDILTALHLRDEDRGMLPAVDRGPPRGLVRAAVQAVDQAEPLPYLRQLPESVFYAARACQLLAGHVFTARQVDSWVARNLDAALESVDPEVEASLPVMRCRTFEDVRNRMLVRLEDLTPEALDRLDAAMQRAERAHRRLALSVL